MGLWWGGEGANCCVFARVHVCVGVHTHVCIVCVCVFVCVRARECACLWVVVVVVVRYPVRSRCCYGNFHSQDGEDLHLALRCRVGCCATDRHTGRGLSVPQRRKEGATGGGGMATGARGGGATERGADACVASAALNGRSTDGMATRATCALARLCMFAPVAKSCQPQGTNRPQHCASIDASGLAHCM